MKVRGGWLSILMTVMIGATACAGAAPGARDNAGPSAPAAPKTLTIGTLGEPVTFEGFTGQGGSRGGAGITGNLIHNHLTEIDPYDQAVPQLVTELPSVERGT